MPFPPRKPTSGWSRPSPNPAAGPAVPVGADPLEQNRSFRAQDVCCRPAEITADMFTFLSESAADRDKRRAGSGIVSEDLGGQDLLKMVCDHDFILSFQRGHEGEGAETLVKGEDAVSLMNDQGFLPLGIAGDQAFGGAQTLFVLVRDRATLLQSKPFLPPNVWTHLLNLVGSRTKHRKLCITLLKVQSAVLSRVIDFLYHNADISTDESEESERIKTVPIDVQPGETGIIMMARFWMREALNRRASDIHIEPMDGKGRIRLRVNGYLEILRDGISLADMGQMVTWIKAQAGTMNISERRRPLDGSMRMSLTDAGVEHIVDVRISATPTVYGQKMVLRLLDPNTLKERSALGLAGAIWDKGVLSHFEKALKMRDGIVLVTGPTGSGKTTTLNVALRYLLEPHMYGQTRNIVTVEDPVEYKIPGINQTQVNEAADVTFATMLRSLLRQDPDIMLVGEIRDRETAQIAVQAALTGHLILSTLHTNDALGAIPRLADLGVSRFLVGSTLRLVQAQRLVRRLCSVCGRRSPVEGDVLARKVEASRLAAHAAALLAPGATVYEPSQCARCGFTGYDSRIAVMEVVFSSPQLVAGIEADLPQVELEQVARRASGFRTMVEGGVDMVAAGATTISEVETICMANLQEDDDVK